MHLLAIIEPERLPSPPEATAGRDRQPPRHPCNLRSLTGHDVPVVEGEATLSDGFSVNLDALNTAASGIIGVLQELESHQVKDIDCESGAFGHDKLAGTTKDFCDRWQKGVKNLAEDGHHIADRLVKTIADYANTDTSGHNRINEAATPGGGGGGDW